MRVKLIYTVHYVTWIFLLFFNMSLWIEVLLITIGDITKTGAKFNDLFNPFHLI